MRLLSPGPLYIDIKDLSVYMYMMAPASPSVVLMFLC